jgi:hypothetical protein
VFDERCSKLRKIAGVTPFVPWFRLSFYRNTDCKVPCSPGPGSNAVHPAFASSSLPPFLQAAAARTSRTSGQNHNAALQYAYGPGAPRYALVSHHLIAYAAFVRKRNSWCGARCLPALCQRLKANAALILVSLLHFERSTVVIRIFFSVFRLPAQVFFCCVLWH